MKFFSFGRRRNSAGTLERALEQLQTAAFYSPSPFAVARQMLELAQVKPEDVLYDLGSGDGRIPIMAAQEFGCRAVGIDLDEKLYLHCEQKVKDYALQERVSFRREDFFKSDLRDATVVIFYLLTQVNGHLAPRLASQLPSGARVVSLDYPVPGWRPEQTVVVTSEGNVEYTVYLYRR
jgi:ribosomal protein L11 methylase PrmA